MSGTLYIVTTPIGNLDDLTPRAAATFESVDFIAAEDTRVTLRLLNHLGIKKSMISYHEYNAPERGEVILQRLLSGESCALCSDAGVPAISDPGEAIVAKAHEIGIRVVPIPAACAAITALCSSGQITGRFVFEGFIPQNRRQRASRLEALSSEQRTIIFYEAPHKLLRSLEDFIAYFGPKRGITICRELTKLHEEIYKTTLQIAFEKYQKTPPRGEFVLVMQGAAPEPVKIYSIEEAVALARNFAEKDKLSASEAAKRAASISKLSKSEIYRNML